MTEDFYRLDKILEYIIDNYYICNHMEIILLIIGILRFVCIISEIQLLIEIIQHVHSRKYVCFRYLTKHVIPYGLRSLHR